MIQAFEWNQSVMNSGRRKLIILIVVTFLLRLGWAASLELSRDEAYHFLYVMHPDWSYFDHPPMLMYLACCGVEAFGGWLHPLSLRIGFILMFAGSTWVLFRWTRKWYGELAGYYAALALNLSVYYSAFAGVLVLPDGPLLFFGLLTMWRLSEALIASPGRIVPWIWVGLACAGAMLSKYQAIFLPLGAVTYIIATPSARWNLRTPGPYVASFIGFLGLIPVLIWNSQHDWISLGFQGSRAVGGSLEIKGLLVFIFGPMALLFPWIWYSLVQVMFKRVRSFRSTTGNDRLLLCLSVLPLVLFGIVSVTRPILPHWPLFGFLPLYPLLGASWAERSLRQPVIVRRWLVFMTTFFLLLAGAFLLQARFGVIKFPFRDPCVEISGWESVGQELAARGLVDRPKTFLFSNHWYESGELAFAVRNRIPVVCYSEFDARGFAFWSRPDDWVGWDGILIDSEQQNNLSDKYKPYFREIIPLPDIEMTRGGRPFLPVRLYLCVDQLRPFPFQYQRKSK